MRYLVAAAAVTLAHAAQAQQLYDSSVSQPFERREIYTTHDEPVAPVAPQAPLPWERATSAEPPFMPFQRAQPGVMQPVPEGPYSTRAVPVENIESAATGEAAPVDATQIANPATEDPAKPTLLTSPIFDASDDDKLPRTVVVRVLNKVTARAETIEAKPGEEVKSGKLLVKPLACYRSLATSQPDTAALLDIAEVPAAVAGVTPPKQKLLFHGWMYQSSPSITALEHPIYDVTMVDCQVVAVSGAKAEKAAKKAKKKAD